METDNSTRMEYCDCCGKFTEQIAVLFNPDNYADGEVWKCTICEEIIDIKKDNS